jgi:hypothetical protein
LVSNCKASNHQNRDEKRLSSVYAPFVKSVSEMFKHKGNRYNIKTIFKTERTLNSPLQTGSERDPQQTAQCVCNIPCECSRSYIGKTGRPLALWLRDHDKISERVFYKSQN